MAKITLGSAQTVFRPSASVIKMFKGQDNIDAAMAGDVTIYYQPNELIIRCGDAGGNGYHMTTFRDDNIKTIAKQIVHAYVCLGHLDEDRKYISTEYIKGKICGAIIPTSAAIEIWT